MKSATTIIRKAPLPKPGDTVVESVKDMRRIYADMNEDKFIRWYENRYKVPAKRIRSILAQHGAEEE